MSNESITITMADGDYRVAVEYTPATSGNRRGHPDNWTPDEPEELIIEEIIDLETGAEIPWSYDIEAATLRAIHEQWDGYAIALEGEERFARSLEY